MASQHAENLAFVFGILGNVVSFMVYLAPIPTFYRIYKKKSTEGFHSLPYLVALFSSALWLFYAVIKKHEILLMTINSFGAFIETVYIVLYIVYATKDKRAWTVGVLVLMNTLLFSLILTNHVSKERLRPEVVGWICVAVSIGVFAAPLSVMAQVIRTRSVEFMPFPLSFFLTLSAVMWFSYGLFTRDRCVALPNVLGFILGASQMILFFFFRRKELADAIPDSEKQPDHILKSIVVLTPGAALEIEADVGLSPSGGFQVHPIA